MEYWAEIVLIISTVDYTITSLKMLWRVSMRYYFDALNSNDGPYKSLLSGNRLLETSLRVYFEYISLSHYRGIIN